MSFDTKVTLLQVVFFLGIVAIGVLSRYLRSDASRERVRVQSRKYAGLFAAILIFAIILFFLHVLPFKTR